MVVNEETSDPLDAELAMLRSMTLSYAKGMAFAVGNV
jgi:hypothetical protein